MILQAIYSNFRQISTMFGYLVAKPTIDQKQEIGRRMMSCYSQMHWQQCEVIADRRTVRTDTRRLGGEKKKKKELESQTAQCMAHLLQGPTAQRPSVVSKAFTIFQHNVPHLSILKSYKDSKALAHSNSN